MFLIFRFSYCSFLLLDLYCIIVIQINRPITKNIKDYYETKNMLFLKYGITKKIANKDENNNHPVLLIYRLFNHNIYVIIIYILINKNYSSTKRAYIREQ